LIGLNVTDKTNKKHFATPEAGVGRGVALTEHVPLGQVYSHLKSLHKNECLFGDQNTKHKCHLKALCIYSSAAPIPELLEKMYVFFYQIESPHMELLYKKVCAGSSHGSNARNYTAESDPRQPP
jgi:hypothetical protein